MHLPSRLANIVAAATILILFLPAMILIAATVALAIPGSPVVMRKTFGSGRSYLVCRYRVAADGEPIGTIGSFPRSTSLDRMPGLIQVVLGRVSLRDWSRSSDV